MPRLPDLDRLMLRARRKREPARDPATLAPSNRLLLSRLERGEIRTVADARAARAAARRLGRRDLEREAERARRVLSRG